MDDERDEARAALLKFAALAVAVAVVVALGTFALVKGLDLGGGSGTPAADPTSTGTPRQLPSVALTPSGEPSSTPSDEPSQEPTPQGISMSMTPTQAQAGERIYITGQYPAGPDAVLQVQREEAGAWTQFADVQLRVAAGSFRTYIVTTRSGAASFRVFDPATGQASDPVDVTIG